MMINGLMLSKIWKTNHTSISLTNLGNTFIVTKYTDIPDATTVSTDLSRSSSFSDLDDFLYDSYLHTVHQYGEYALESPDPPDFHLDSGDFATDSPKSLNDSAESFLDTIDTHNQVLQE